MERGVLTLYVAGEDGEIRRHVASPGEVVAIPGGREHTIRNESCEEARALAVFAPGAPMEGFIRAAAALTEPDMAAALALAAEHGIEMTRELEAVPDGVPDDRPDRGRAELVEHYLGYEPVMTQVGRDHGLLVHAVATPRASSRSTCGRRGTARRRGGRPARLDVVRGQTSTSTATTTTWRTTCCSTPRGRARSTGRGRG